jgi:hypothetical protein
MRVLIPRDIFLAIALTLPAAAIVAQQALPTAITAINSRAPLAATAPTPVPALVPFSAVTLDSKGKPFSGQTSATFLIYKDQQGGEPLFAESQMVSFDPAGHYEVHLGATSPNGLPADLFTSGEARWLEVQIAGRPAEGRMLMASVPYAMKAADAATLGGFTAQSFVTHAQLAATAQALAVQAVQQITPLATPTGSGTTNYVPLWTSASVLGSSEIYQSTSGSVRSYGIGTTSPAARVHIVGTGGTVPSLVIQGGGGLGVIKMGGDVNANTLTASVRKLARITMPDWAADSLGVTLFSGDVTGANANDLYFGGTPGGSQYAATGLHFVTATNGTTTGGTEQATLTSAGSFGIGTTTPAAKLEVNGTAKFDGLVTFATGQTYPYGGSGPITSTTTSGTAVEGTSSTGTGVEGVATGAGGVGVYANATGGVNGTTYPIAVKAHVVSGHAIIGALDTGLNGQTAILGQTGGPSAQYTGYLSDGLIGGVWGDVADSANGVPMAVAGTADNGYAGVFENTSNVWPTLYLYNKGTAGLGNLSSGKGNPLASSHFDTLLAGNANGTCGIGGNGSLSCTGQIKSLMTTPASGRTVETYSMQSAENWMEDFGSGRLSSGSAMVTIDPAFAQTTSGSAEYHVFLTANGESKNLYVTNKTASGFEVHEADGGTASIGFDYRIVAKRRGLEAQRLTDVTDTFKAETSSAPMRKRALNKSPQTR